jgi:hypothetical protein
VTTPLPIVSGIHFSAVRVGTWRKFTPLAAVASLKRSFVDGAGDDVEFDTGPLVHPASAAASISDAIADLIFL